MQLDPWGERADADEPLHRRTGIAGWWQGASARWLRRYLVRQARDLTNAGVDRPRCRRRACQSGQLRQSRAPGRGTRASPQHGPARRSPPRAASAAPRHARPLATPPAASHEATGDPRPFVDPDADREWLRLPPLDRLSGHGRRSAPIAPCSALQPRHMRPAGALRRTAAGRVRRQSRSARSAERR